MLIVSSTLLLWFLKYVNTTPKYIQIKVKRFESKAYKTRTTGVASATLYVTLAHVSNPFLILYAIIKYFDYLVKASKVSSTVWPYLLQ